MSLRLLGQASPPVRLRYPAQRAHVCPVDFLVDGIPSTGSKIGAEGMEVTKAEGGAGVPEERRENGGRFDWSGFFKVSTYPSLLLNTDALCPFICSSRKKENRKICPELPRRVPSSEDSCFSFIIWREVVALGIH